MSADDHGPLATAREYQTNRHLRPAQGQRKAQRGSLGGGDQWGGAPARGSDEAVRGGDGLDPRQERRVVPGRHRWDGRLGVAGERRGSGFPSTGNHRDQPDGSGVDPAPEPGQGDLLQERECRQVRGLGYRFLGQTLGSSRNSGSVPGGYLLGSCLRQHKECICRRSV